MALTDKQALKHWEQQVVKQIKKATPVDISENSEDKAARIKKLKADWKLFIPYYFPAAASAEFANFHKKFAKAILENDRLYIVRKWARDHGKTTFIQMLVIYLMIIEEFHTLIYVSKTADASEEMLRFIRLQLEANQRLINDYGDFRSYGSWADDKFVTKKGVSFRALGKGQSPRGTKEEERRPDIMVIDDLDDDEECRNKTRIDNSWEWLMGALFGAFDIKGRKRFIFVNNKIAKDCLVERASKIADDTETINIYDKDGNPSWHQRYSKDDCEYMIKKMGEKLSQQEYFNNPMVEGKTFKAEWLQYKKMHPLRTYPHLLAYLDPSYSNNTKKNADHKALVLIGLAKAEYHIIKAFCGPATIAQMVEWHYEMDRFLRFHNAIAQFYMEDVFIQKQFFQPHFETAAIQKGFPLGVSGDKRQKPDKDVRIASLQGYFQNGNAFFNEDEKENHHMQRLVEQFLLFEPGNSKVKKDGPDATEGGIYLLKQRILSSQPVIIGARSGNKYDY